jgi:hypothetical protein
MIYCKSAEKVMFPLILLLLVGLRPTPLAAQTVVYLGADSDTSAQSQLRTAAEFYGVDVRALSPTEQKNAQALRSALQHDNVLGAVVTASALHDLSSDRLLSELQHGSGHPIPVLVADITPELASSLSQWSAGSLVNCEPVLAGESKTNYVFGKSREITGQLAGEQVTGKTVHSCTFSVRNGKPADALISAASSKVAEPTFVRVAAGKRTIFFSARTIPDTAAATHNTLISVFDNLAPMLMFVRYCAGDRGWHSVGHVANFTIDDPWLTEPYGNLNYHRLFNAMEQHNFHTTIAFIPWNFDRSEPDVVELFRAHPERFSIAIHGNNHNHAEFGDYKDAPFDVQVKNIEQSLARMERFRQLTGIPYDRVMVFPHTTGPEATIAELKKHGLLATANALAFPLDAKMPEDPTYLLRTYNVRFANFPEIGRYSVTAAAPRADFAIDAFLDNPILIYGHEQDFDFGMDGINRFADKINKLQPDTRWCSLESIAEHLYLVKRRTDWNFDVQLYAASAILQNPTQHDVLFFVRKPENFVPAVQRLRVDGEAAAFSKSDGALTFQLTVPAGGSRRIEIDSDWLPAGTDVSKSGLRLTALRRFSDFRDMVLARYALGRALTRFYYTRGLASAEQHTERLLLKHPALLLLLIALLAAASLGRRSAQTGAATDSRVAYPRVARKRANR